jgi:hypothetical protein
LSQAWLALALPVSSKTAAQSAIARIEARFIVPSNTSAAQGSGRPSRRD